MTTPKLKILKKIFKWLDKYIVTVAAVTGGLFMFYHQFERPNLKTPDSIMFVEGQVVDYSFQRKIGYRATRRQYYIWLDNYPCTFQIKADFISYFYQSKFETGVIKGDKIKLSIPKEYENQLQNNDSKIIVLSISKYATDFLSLKDTIRKENDNFDIYSGLFFITAGGIFYLLKRKSIIK